MAERANLFPSRRAFLYKAGFLTGGIVWSAGRLKQSPIIDQTSTDQELPRRILGKTGAPITALSLDTAPCGQSSHISAREIASIVNQALHQGINSINTARAHGNAEEGIGKALGSRRRDVFLSTKVWADTIADADVSLTASLKLLRTDYVDLLYFHNLGTQNFAEATDRDGVFTWLLKQKQLGKTRFVGISGHNLSERFPAYIETGQIDAIMMVLNFVDRYIYSFEEKILPLARRHNLGIVAMKVYGGVRGGLRNYAGPKAPPQMPDDYLQLALRYVLSLPDVTTASIGVHDVQQVRNNIAMVRDFKPLALDEQRLLEKVGRQLAARWRPHFGPILQTPATA